MLKHLLENCPKDIQKYFLREKFSRGDIIILQGENEDYIYLLLHGSIKIYCNMPNGLQYMLIRLSDMEIVGDVGILVRQKAGTNVEAETECDTLRLEKTKFLQWMKEDWNFAYYVMTSLAEKLYYYTANSSLRFIMTVDERLMEMLQNAVSEGKSEVSKPAFFYELFTTPRSFNRALKKLSDQGVISIQGDKIIILNKKHLMKK